MNLDNDELKATKNRNIVNNMSEEEKKAIDLLKILQKKTPFILWGDKTPYNKSNQIQTVLNLIERQQKEIEEMRRELERHIKFCEQESKGHINNEVCHISLKFNKKLLEIINRKVENDE